MASHAITRQPGGRPLSIREGQFGVGERSVIVFNVLFDTGAFHKSYISSDLVEKHREDRNEFIVQSSRMFSRSNDKDRD